MPEFPGYRIERELGRGAMAVVYLATQLSLHRAVALKVLDRGVDGYADMAQRFIHEAHTLAGLHHRNIVTVFDVVESAQGDFISMEFLNRGSLGDRLAVGMTLQQSLAVLAQLGSALEAAHASGVVHRDIKPENVLFRDEDTPVLADFGIARELKSDAHMTRDGLVVGTPSYMAPEQISGDPIDGRADQYSLGVMWFQMLTGRLPYEADNTTSLLHAHMARSIPDLPSSLSVLQPVINRMLAKTPNARYPDMAAMLLDVGRQLLRAPELLRTPPGMATVSPTERLHQLGILTTGIDPQQAADATQPAQAANQRSATTPSVTTGRRTGLRIGAAAMVLLALGLLAYGFRAQFSSPAPATAGSPPAPMPAAADASIAVLPFVSLSADKDQEYFADGISEELLNQLARVPGLRVIARTSSFSFKGQQVEISEIARRLNVAHVLEGSIRKSGNKVRITAQLIRTSDSSHLWSETYDRELTDVFEVQDEISAAVVDQLKLKLLGEATPKSRAVSPEAYALFLQARQFSRQGTNSGFGHSVALLKQALKLEPDYAEAWAALGRDYAFLANEPAAGSSAVFIQLAREASNKALAIDPDLAQAHVKLARIAMMYDNDLSAAARYINHALALAPDDPEVLSVAASLAASLGRLESAIVMHEASTLRDPESALEHVNLAVAYYNTDRLDEALASSRRALAISPDYPALHYLIGTVLLAKGQPQAALAEMKRETSDAWRLIGMPMVWHSLGEETKAEAALAKLIAEQQKGTAYNIAYVQSVLGHPDQAFEWLDKAVTTVDPGLSGITTQPEFANLRKDPRWLPFLRKIGKAPEQLAAIRFEVPLPKQTAAP